MAGNTSSSSRNNSETASSSSSSSSPIIAMLPQDHLLSILLLLPVDSILRFGMTCKRFGSLVAHSDDTLWQSLCKRDWGPPSDISLDALLLPTSSNHHHHFRSNRFPWKKLYQRIYQLHSVSCHKLSLSSDPDSDPLIIDGYYPGPRASHSLNSLSGSLVLFGGGSEGGRHLDDTWIGYIGNGLKRIVKWQKVNTGIPSGRFGHSCVVIVDHLVLFGGINDNGIRQNDTWIGKVTFHETLGITFSWRLLEVGSVAPPPRGAHAGCSIDNKRMLIHGGIGLSGLRLGDSWVLDLSDNLCFGTWCEVVAQPSPAARSGHTLTYIGGSQTILFGGRGLGYEVLNDVWVFDTCDGQFRWVQLVYELQDVPDGVSLPRVGHSATLILGGRVLIHGGEDTYRHRKNDFWVLDIKARPPSNQQRSFVGNNNRMWKRLKSEEESFIPKCRSFHRACTDNSGCCLYVFGGMVDGLIQPAEAFGLRFDGELFLVELVV